MTDEERHTLLGNLRIAEFAAPVYVKQWCKQAADEIERLEKENGRLTQALIDNYATSKIREQPRSDWIISDD